MLKGLLGKGKGKHKGEAPKEFLPPDYDFQAAPKACHSPPDQETVAIKSKELFEGTYSWLFNEVTEWANEVSGDKQIFLIQGKSGVGKTVFMSELARRCYSGMADFRAYAPETGQKIDICATYFFNKFDLRRANVKTLIRSLSDQLRNTVDGFTEALLKQDKILLKSRDTYILNEFKLRRLTVEDLFDALIGKPSSLLGENVSTKIILFDALNACDRIYLEPLLRLLKNWKILTPDWLRLVVTATHNDERVSSLGDIDIVQLCDISSEQYRERVIMDVSSYAENILSEEFAQSDETALNAVLTASENRLLYITVLKVWLNMKPTINPFEQDVIELPIGMNELYSSLFRTFKEKFSEQYLPFLAPLMAARCPLPKSVWRECCPEVGESTFNQMLAALDTVLYIHHAEVVFTHRTAYAWLIQRERPEIWLSNMTERAKLFGIEIFSGHFQSAEERRKSTIEENDAVARLERQKLNRNPNASGAVALASRRKLVVRKSGNDDLLIKPQLGHRALAKWCWTAYRREKKADQQFTIENLVYHLVFCKDESADVNRDQDASNLLRSFDFNIKRLLGKNVIESIELIDHIEHGEGYAANVSGALHDAFNVYLLKHPEDRAVRIVQNAMNKARAALTEDPRQLASQLLARIDFESNQNELGELHKRCMEFDCGVPWWRPVTPNLNRADVAKIEVIKEFKNTYVKCIVVSPDGTSIVAGNNTGIIKMFEANRGRSLFTLDTKSKASVNSLDFYFDQDDDELHLASGSSDGYLRIWDIERGVLKSQVKIGKKGIAAVGYMQNPNISMKERKIKAKQEEEEDDLDNDDDDVKQDESSTDSDDDSDEDDIDIDHFFEEKLIVGTLDGDVYLTYPDRGETVRIDNIEFPVTAIVTGEHSGNYHIFAVASTSGTIAVYDINNQRSRLKTLRHEDRVWDIRFHPVLNQLLSCSEDETVTLWDLDLPSDEDAELRTYENISQKGNPVMCINFSPDGKHFVTGSKDGKILVVQTYAQDRIELGEDEDEHDFKVSENGYVNLTNAYRKDPDAEAKALMELNLPEELSGAKLSMEGHTGWIADVCFFPKSERIVSASKDGNIIFWSYDIRDVFNTEVSSPHTLPITSAAFGPENNYFVTGAKDKKIVGWDVRTGTHRFVKSHLYVPKRIVFSQDGIRVGVYTEEDSICLSAKTGKSAHNIGAVFNPGKDSMARDLSVNDFVTLPLKLPGEEENKGVPFTTDIPRRGAMLLSNNARKIVKEGKNKNVYALVVARNRTSLLQLVLPTKTIKDDVSEKTN